jgi:hypothetical protein
MLAISPKLQKKNTVMQECQAICIGKCKSELSKTFAWSGIADHTIWIGERPYQLVRYHGKKCKGEEQAPFLTSARCGASHQRTEYGFLKPSWS